MFKKNIKKLVQRTKKPSHLLPSPFYAINNNAFPPFITHTPFFKLFGVGQLREGEDNSDYNIYNFS